MSDSRKITLDKKDFQIGNITTDYGFTTVIMYKKMVAMWNCVSPNLDNYEFYILHEQQAPDYQVNTIICKDELGDMYTYGNFATLEQVQDWCEKPYSLY